MCVIFPLQISVMPIYSPGLLATHFPLFIIFLYCVSEIWIVFTGGGGGGMMTGDKPLKLHVYTLLGFNFNFYFESRQGNLSDNMEWYILNRKPILDCLWVQIR